MAERAGKEERRRGLRFRPARGFRMRLYRTRRAPERGDKKHGSKSAYQKVKFDRQIVAIAKSRNARLIVSDDDSLRRVALSVGLQVSTAEELPIPDDARQLQIFKK